MTTHKEQLLKQLGFHNVDRLKSLSSDDALRLFALHALGVDNFDSHTPLKPQGEGIDEVLNSEIWDVEIGNDTGNGKDIDNSDKIVSALRISYHDLSADLKRLFAYCSLFPKDFLFDKEGLVLLWMAEGFLNPSHATKSLERFGHEHFEILLSRSFFQQAPNQESLFIIHDLMNDLATFVAKDFYLRFENHTKIGTKYLAKHRHMSFAREEYVGYHKFEAFKIAKSLRTFLAISINNFAISEVPDFIGGLKHLRYLNLSQTKIKELTENVCNLYNLQTLIVSRCGELSKLPKSFMNLKRLRHFDIRYTPLLEKLPLGIGELENLEILTKIIIDGDYGFAINELKGLKNLHGEVSIKGLHKVQSAIDAREANLSLKKITGLELQWIDVFDGSRMGTLEKEVLNELKPNNDTLKELLVVSYAGTKFPDWVGDISFHKLVNVSIRGCRKCTSLPSFRLLPSLKELLIQGMDAAKIIGLELTRSDVSGFSSLEVLTFEDMSQWEGWSTKKEGLVAVFPCLKKLHIEKCPKLINISLQALHSLKVLEIDGCGDGVLRSLVQGLHIRYGEML
ncbi:putative leucine-rich repeat domain superfamily [Helianthus annuus]|nr:putative leucine-rich repeat domain superfamily [Helianthus annuus]